MPDVAEGEVRRAEEVTRLRWKALPLLTPLPAVAALSVVMKPADRFRFRLLQVKSLLALADLSVSYPMLARSHSSRYSVAVRDLIAQCRY